LASKPAGKSTLIHFIKKKEQVMSMNFLLIYASATGNTRVMAQSIAEGIRLSGGNVTVKEVVSARPGELKDYDGILLGAYTWGDGELPDEFLDFYEAMEGMQLPGTPAAVFGSCDSQYESYGAAVDLLQDMLASSGAKLVQIGLKVDRAPGGKDKKRCNEFGSEFVRLAAGSALKA
jgi:flavodoxin I